MPDAILIETFCGRTLAFRHIGTFFSCGITQNAANTGDVVADADAIVYVAAADAACAIKYFGIRQRRFGACPVDAEDAGTTSGFAAAAYAVGKSAAALSTCEFVASFGIIAARIVRFTGTDAKRQGN